MDAAAIDQVRRFNRTVAQRAGTLSDRFLGRDRPLGPSRVLWEIGRDGCSVRVLRSRLGLDSGHLSRLLRSLEAEGLVRVEPDATDRRVRVAKLTKRGLAERRVIDARADAVAESILAPLSPGHRAELVAAMRKVDRLMTLALVELRVTDPRHPDARRCIDAYVAELNERSERGDDPAAGVSADPEELEPPAGIFLVVYLRGEAVGCGGSSTRPAGRRRSSGCGWRRRHGLRHRAAPAQRAGGPAGRAGADVAHIETNGTLAEAIVLYRSVGYVEVAPFNDEPFADHWFEKPLA